MGHMQKVHTTRPRGYTTLYNSAKHEILNAYKYKNIKKFSIFSGLDNPRMRFFLLTNVTISTTVGILTFMSKKILYSTAFIRLR